MTHGSDELRSGTEEYWIGDGSMPKNEGTYQLQYGLGGVVEFQTSAPTLEASATAVLQHNDEFVDPETGESLSLPLKAI
ncbi:MAG: hypothetical protein LC114_15285 [Bryobacterales bacterium]|nr:hypothetical protein [Bryobacterales bacterium]